MKRNAKAVLQSTSSVQQKSREDMRYSLCSMRILYFLIHPQGMNHVRDLHDEDNSGEKQSVVIEMFTCDFYDILREFRYRSSKSKAQLWIWYFCIS